MLSLILTAIGSIGGFVLLFKAYRRLRYGISAQLAARGARNRAQYYMFTEASCRWIKQGKRYRARRRLDIVSLSDRLESLRVGMGPASTAKWTVTRGQLRQVNSLPPGTDWIDYVIDFDPPLSKGEKRTIEYEYEADAHIEGGLPNLWLYVCESRLDELLLRVVFHIPPIEGVRFRCISQTGITLSEDRLPVDPISYECTKRIIHTQPGVQYVMDWL